MGISRSFRRGQTHQDISQSTSRKPPCPQSLRMMKAVFVALVIAAATCLLAEAHPMPNNGGYDPYMTGPSLPNLGGGFYPRPRPSVFQMIMWRAFIEHMF